jgi:cobalt-precorrin 5A hydrolase / precorrin-3B C17-methyltransferase
MSDERLPAGSAIVVLGPGAMVLARRLRDLLPGATIHGLAQRVDGADVTFVDTADHLGDLFAAGTPIIGLCAAGILVRALASGLADKRAEPPVLAVAVDGSVAVPLLGGHHGANRLARAIAEATGGTAAVTTAGDVRHGLALDEPPPGWRVADAGPAKAIAGDLLAGRPVKLVVEAGDAGWLTKTGAPFGEAGERAVRVTHRVGIASGDDLILHPPVLAVGVGCDRGTAPDELIGLVEGTLSQNGLAADAVACVVSVDLKADEAAVHAVATALGVPARFFPVDVLEAESPRLANPSEVVFRNVGCHGVAEGAALAAVGAEGTLLVEKTAATHATCAVALGPMIDGAGVGRPQGRLYVVGIGPGPGDWRTPEATRALGEASDVVGYGLYLDLVADAIAGKTRHATPMTTEDKRVRLALDLAAEGRTVALVSSGDAGIYGMASLAFELLEREDRPEWNRLHISVVPGVTAAQAAAARIGAPLGHDFCIVSLSDLLTPWPEIARRLRAAAAGDFIVGLYNPVSKRRRQQLVEARDILLTERGPETPTVLARNVGRDGETIEVIRLADLEPDRADMLTVIVVGNSQTKMVERGVGRWVYTPRGYEKKLNREAE